MSISPVHDVALEMASLIAEVARDVAANNNKGEREMIGAAFTEFADTIDRLSGKTRELLTGTVTSSAAIADFENAIGLLIVRQLAITSPETVITALEEQIAIIRKSYKMGGWINEHQ